MRNLNKEESEQYIKVIKQGNMDNMADFAYNLGWKSAMQYLKDETEKFTQGFAYKKKVELSPTNKRAIINNK